MVVGVHTPETAREADRKRLADYVAREKIRWRVAIDPDFAAWRRFEVEAWPTIVLIDRQGLVRAAHVGDDQSSAIEAELARLLGG